MLIFERHTEYYAFYSAITGENGNSLPANVHTYSRNTIENDFLTTKNKFEKR